MEETKWWTRLLLVSAIIAVVLLAAGPLGYKFGASPLAPSLISLLLSLAGAVIVFVASLIMVIVAHRGGLERNRNLLLVTMGICLVPMVVMGPQIATARSVPPIHDITTDTDDPPAFVEIVSLRANAPNDLEYGSEMEPAAKLARLQQEAYPDIETLESDLGVAEAVARAEAVLSDLGMEVVNVDAEQGIVEAVDTTFWFGFKDDVVVRVRPSASGSIVDIRSVSRVGQSDVGKNASRIRSILAAFRDRR